jgi:hypothetical protein
VGTYLEPRLGEIYLTSKRWANEEIQILRKMYPYSKKEDIMVAIPNREWQYIVAQGTYLKIKRQRTYNHFVTWNEKEEESLRQLYPLASKSEILDVLKGHSWGGIMTHAERLKIKRLTFWGETHPNWKGDNVSAFAGRCRARRRYKRTDGKEIHHKDGNPLNNVPENIMLVTRKEHMNIDGRMKRPRHKRLGRIE